jgi:hypothetical protein
MIILPTVITPNVAGNVARNQAMDAAKLLTSPRPKAWK